MNTLTLSVASLDDFKERALAAVRGEVQGAFHDFATVDLLWKTLTPKRWAIIRAMTGQGPMSIREVSRRVGRDVKGVHGDVQALLKAGVLDRDDRGVVFPYDAVRVEFTLEAATAA